MAICLSTLALSSPVLAEEDAPPASKELLGKVIAAAGGEGKLLTIFRMKERFNAGMERVSPGSSRESVVEPPSHWWIDTKERGMEPAKTAAWAWTLGVLTHPKSKIERVVDVTDNDQTWAGMRVTGSVDPALDMYFDKATHELMRVDWRNDIYRFSEWKEHDGTRYPSKCVMHRRNTGKPWFFHEIVTLERLKELPSGLKR